MRASAEMTTLDAWYDHRDVDQVMDWVEAEVRAKRLGTREAQETAEDIDKARERDHQRVFRKRTGEIEGELQIVAAPPLIVPIEDLAGPGVPPGQIDRSMRKLIASYRRTVGRYHHPVEEFEYVHAARKVVGVGSVGTRAWILLMVGRDENDPLFLQAKEAQPSVLERFVGRSEHANHGRRVVVGQRLMQAASDFFLGWVRVKDLDGRTRDYYIRQLHDWKGGVEVESFRVPGATLYGRLCGATLARAHARWGDRLAIASYLGKGDAFDRAIADFSRAYADQNERDYETFAKAVESGRLEAQDRPVAAPVSTSRALRSRRYCAGPDSGRTVELAAFPYWSSQVMRYAFPGVAWRSSSCRLVGDETLCPPKEVITSPAASPALSAGPPWTTPSTIAPDTSWAERPTPRNAVGPTWTVVDAWPASIW